jgi:hypothetical protein
MLQPEADAASQVVSAYETKLAVPPLTLNDLRICPASFARLPKLDLAGSSPVARSTSSCDY